MADLTPFNAAALVKRRIATEYRGAARLRAYILALLSEHNTLDALFIQLSDRLNIDTQEGVNLEKIGKIVGQDRGVTAASQVSFFGFSPHPQAKGFGSPTNPSAGGRFRGPGEPLTGDKLLSDKEYQRFIRAKIFKNHAHSHPDELIRFLKLVLGEDTPIFLTNQDPAPGHARIHIGRRISIDEQYLLNDDGFLPTTIGVTYHITSIEASFAVINELALVVPN